MTIPACPWCYTEDVELGAVDLLTYMEGDVAEPYGHEGRCGVCNGRVLVITDDHYEVRRGGGPLDWPNNIDGLVEAIDTLARSLASMTSAYYAARRELVRMIDNDHRNPEGA